MKQYFAKYLPVEGEIKEGDHILINNIIGIVGSAVEFFEGCKKVKLFLCSRDIQIGDIVFCRKNLSLGEHVVKESEFPDVIEWEGETCTPDDLLKRIGEISPEATWVVENQEFEEKEIAWITDDGEETKILIDKDWDWEHWNPKGAIFAIKGPCGHFH